MFEKKLSGETNTDFICAYTVSDRLQQEIIRENHSARQAQKNQQHTIKIRERTDPSHPLIRDWFWTWRASRRHASISCGTVFQTALPLLLVIPRLRPGLLSLRSVLASSQILLFSIMNYALWIMHYELCIMNYVLWIMHYELCIMNYNLFLNLKKQKSDENDKY